MTNFVCLLFMDTDNHHRILFDEILFDNLNTLRISVIHCHIYDDGFISAAWVYTVNNSKKKAEIITKSVQREQCYDTS